MAITAKTVIFDISSHYAITGDGYTSVRSIEFYLGETRLDLTSSDFTAYATSYFSTSYLPKFAFDTTLSKLGSYSGREWLTSSFNGGEDPQRLIIVFNTEQIFDKLVINNSHDSASVKGGIKNVVISYSALTETETDPDVEIESAIVLKEIVVAVHSSADEEDPQEFRLNNYQITGLLKDASNTPLEGDVYIYDQATGNLKGKQAVSSSGSFGFSFLDPNLIYFVVAIVEDYQAQAYQDIIPILLEV